MAALEEFLKTTIIGGLPQAPTAMLLIKRPDVASAKALGAADPTPVAEG